MARSHRSDSIHGQTLQANAPDISTLPPPHVDGVEVLDAVGQKFFADTWRSDPEKWTVGDLAMLVEAAYVFQKMRENRMVCSMTPLLFELRNGVLTRHPVHVAQIEFSRQFQTLCRDLNIRNKDGAKTAKLAAAPVAPAATSNGDVLTFEDYLHGSD